MYEFIIKLFLKDKHSPSKKKKKIVHNNNTLFTAVFKIFIIYKN